MLRDSRVCSSSSGGRHRRQHVAGGIGAMAGESPVIATATAGKPLPRAARRRANSPRPSIAGRRAIGRQGGRNGEGLLVMAGNGQQSAPADRQPGRPVLRSCPRPLLCWPADRLHAWCRPGRRWPRMARPWLGPETHAGEERRTCRTSKAPRPQAPAKTAFRPSTVFDPGWFDPAVSLSGGPPSRPPPLPKWARGPVVSGEWEPGEARGTGRACWPFPS